MAAEVKAYLSYLKSTQEALDLNLELKRITWVSDCWNNSYNHVTVWVDKVKAFEKTGVESRTLRADTGGFTAFPLKRKLDDRITFDVRIVNEDWFWGGGHHDHGKNITKESVEELARSGRDIPLGFDHGTNEVRFEISGAPTPPELPAWRPRP